MEYFFCRSGDRVATVKLPTFVNFVQNEVFFEKILRKKSINSNKKQIKQMPKIETCERKILSSQKKTKKTKLLKNE